MCPYITHRTSAVRRRRHHKTRAPGCTALFDTGTASDVGETGKSVHWIGPFRKRFARSPSALVRRRDCRRRRGRSDDGDSGAQDRTHPSGPPGRRPYARREDPGQRRVALQVTNTIVPERDFWGGRRTIVRRILRAFPVAETVSFFERMAWRCWRKRAASCFLDESIARRPRRAAPQRSRRLCRTALRHSRGRVVATGMRS